MASRLGKNCASCSAKNCLSREQEQMWKRQMKRMRKHRERERERERTSLRSISLVYVIRWYQEKRTTKQKKREEKRENGERMERERPTTHLALALLKPACLLVEWMRMRWRQKLKRQQRAGARRWSWIGGCGAVSRQSAELATNHVVRGAVRRRCLDAHRFGCTPQLLVQAARRERRMMI